MNAAQLAKFCTSALDFAPGLDEACERFAILAGLRLQHFLAQVAHESAGFTRLEENLNYSAEALQRVFPRYFSNEDIADEYARHPERIANRVYANRMGNGNEASGDGWRNRGVGLIQITGADNRRACSRFFFNDDRLLADPEWLLSPAGAPLAAGWFWHAHDLNDLADEDDLESITRRVNGGLNGIGDRQQWLERAKECFA